MSTNISKQKREELLAKIKAIRTFIASAEQDENTGNLLAYLSELERDVGGKKYGLVFEEHREEIDEILATHTPVLTEDGSLLIDNGGQMNFLLEGDNLASLQLLLKTHKGKIDLIYIDPPYNTGHNDFAYDDNFVSANDAFLHSKWLSFMRNRLALAKNLLSPVGCIFISINDIEQSQLKLLCDSIFGESNFIATLPKKGSGGRQDSKHFAVVHEYVLCYARNANYFVAGREEKESGDYPLMDETTGRRYKLQLLRKWGDSSRRIDRPNLYYPLYYSEKSGEISTEPIADGIIIYPMLSKTEEGRWRWGKSTMQENIENGVVIFQKKSGEYVGYEKIYEPTEVATKPYTTWIDDIDNNTGSTLLKNILGKTAFDYPKPLDLIEKLLRRGTDRTDITVLDFFAGSGTTGHAVMKLNAEDGGTRRFILCTNNENNICREVTYERIRRVIDKEGYAASLKYFKVEYVPIDSRMYYEYADELLRHIRELVELENGVNFTANAEIGIVLTEEELEEFVGSDAFALCRKLYIGHDILPTDEQMAAIKAGGIEISVIPDYYYKDLQEG